MAQTDLFRKVKSLFSTTLVTDIGTGTSDTITLSSASGLPTDTEITLTFDRVDQTGAALPAANMERITGTISGSVLTSYTRAIEGTEQAHSSGCVIEYIPNADDINDMVDGILVEHDQDGKHTTVTATTVTTTGLVDAATLKIATSTVEADNILDEDTMASDSATALATQQSIKAYVDSDWQTASDGATVTFDLGTGAYRKHRVTLGGNRVLALSNVGAGQAFIIALTQDGTGSRTVTWFSTIRWADGSAPTLTTTLNKRDVLGFIQTGTDTYDGFVVGQNL